MEGRKGPFAVVPEMFSAIDKKQAQEGNSRVRLEMTKKCEEMLKNVRKC